MIGCHKLFLMENLHPAVKVERFGELDQDPDYVFICPHDGDPVAFWNERGSELSGFLDPVDAGTFLKYLEIERDSGAADLMRSVASLLAKRGVSVDTLSFELPRGIIDANRTKISDAFYGIWGERAYDDSDFTAFREEMRVAHSEFIEAVRGYLERGFPAVDWHTMGPYSGARIPGGLAAYVEGFNRSKPGIVIDSIVAERPAVPNADLCRAITGKLRPEAIAENDPYGRGIQITATWRYMRDFPGQMVCFDVPKAVLKNGGRQELSTLFAGGILDHFRPHNSAHPGASLHS